MGKGGLTDSIEMLSIVVPVYNVERYLRQSIESVLAQNCVDWELILVDDGSTDSSGAICDEYAEKESRITVIHKGNEGVSAARNVGIEAAKGEYVSFIDSDDWVEPNYVSTLLYEIGDYEILYFGHFVERGNTTIRREVGNVLVTNRAEVELELAKLKRNTDKCEHYGFTWNKVFRKEIVESERVRFDEEFRHREDELFTSDYTRYLTKLKCINEVLYHYRVLPQSLSHGVRQSSKTYYDIAMRLQLNIPYLTNKTLISIEEQRIVRFIGIALVYSKSFREFGQNIKALFAIMKGNNLGLLSEFIEIVKSVVLCILKKA